MQECFSQSAGGVHVQAGAGRILGHDAIEADEPAVGRKPDPEFLPMRRLIPTRPPTPHRHIPLHEPIGFGEPGFAFQKEARVVVWIKQRDAAVRS